MDAKCQDNRHVLNSLYLKLKDYQSIFLTVEDLKLLGVEASRVGIFNEQLQFDPCFFRPHPERVLHKYPLGRNDIERLDSPPTLYDFLNEAKKFSTDEKEQLTIAKSSHKAHYEDSTHCGCDSIALDAYEHVDSHLTRPRRRNPDDEKFRDWFHLESLTDFEYFDWEKGLKKGDPLPIQISPRDMYWVVKSAYRPWDNGNRAKPHCIINVLSTAYASEEDQSLTLHELKAIVNVMLPRVVRGRYRTADIHPLLLISYSGFKHGRIIQASYDGKQLTLQFSHLWSFEREETAPTELFCRYLLGEAVGLQKSALCVR